MFELANLESVLTVYEILIHEPYALGGDESRLSIEQLHDVLVNLSCTLRLFAEEKSLNAPDTVTQRLDRVLCQVPQVQGQLPKVDMPHGPERDILYDNGDLVEEIARRNAVNSEAAKIAHTLSRLYDTLVRIESICQPTNVTSFNAARALH